MFNKLEGIIKKCSGNVLTVCVDSKLLNFLNANDNIGLISIESNRVSGIGSYKKSKKKKLNGSKNINFKKLRKYIVKKSVDSLFCNMNEIMDYYKHFIKDSIYLCKGKIYIYFDSEIDPEFIINKYKRYTKEIELSKYKNGYLVIVDASNAKNNFIKDKLYFIHDTMYNLIETIGNILVS